VAGKYRLRSAISAYPAAEWCEVSRARGRGPRAVTRQVSTRVPTPPGRDLCRNRRAAVCRWKLASRSVRQSGPSAGAGHLDSRALPDEPQLTVRLVGDLAARQTGRGDTSMPSVPPPETAPPPSPAALLPVAGGGIGPGDATGARREPAQGTLRTPPPRSDQHRGDERASHPRARERPLRRRRTAAAVPDMPALDDRAPVQRCHAPRSRWVVGMPQAASAPPQLPACPRLVLCRDSRRRPPRHPAVPSRSGSAPGRGRRAPRRSRSPWPCSRRA